MDRILVTGGSGFIGTHLCRELVKRARVTVIDLREPEQAVPGVEYRVGADRGDVRSAAVLDSAIRGVDAVFHLAAMVSVPLCQERPVESFETNLMGTVKVLEAIRRESDRRGKKLPLVFAGSSVVYGNSGRLDEGVRETAPLGEPLSVYGAQKLGSEHAIRLFQQAYGIPSTVFRFFNVYGAGQDPKSPYSGVISIFAERILSGDPLRLNGGGKQTRDFVSVQDLVRALAMAITLPPEKCDGIPINLGRGDSVSVEELAQLMMEVAGQHVSLEPAPARAGDVLHSQADISRAKAVLGWKPEIDLRTGIRDLFADLLRKRDFGPQGSGRK